MKMFSVSNVVDELRRELAELSQNVVEKNIAFQVEEAEIELQFAIVDEGGGRIGFSCWVFDAQAEAKQNEGYTQKVKLKLSAIDFAGKQISISDETGRPE